MPETIGKCSGSKAEDASNDVSCSRSTRFCTLHKRSEKLALQKQDGIAKEFHTDAEDRGLVLAEQLRENSAIAGVKRGSPEPTFEAKAMLSIVEAAQQGSEVTPEDTVMVRNCLLYTSPSPRDATLSRMPSSA